MKIFDCLAYVHLLVEKRESKLDPRFKEWIFLGYEDGVSKTKIVSKDVVFNEKHMLNKSRNEESVASELQKHPVEVELLEEIIKSEEIEDNHPLDPQERSYNLVRDRERRVSKLVQRFEFEDMIVFVLIAGSGDSISYQNAIKSEDNGKWSIAMAKEIEFLQKNQTWELV